MSLLLTGLLIFFAGHLVSAVNRPWRDHMVVRLGLLPWKGLYSLVALVGFVMLVIGYDQARLTQPYLYPQLMPLRHLAMLLLLPVFPLLLAAYLPGRISAHTKHPMLAATMIWGVAHLLVNGQLSDILLFGGFVVWALAVRLSYRKRPDPARPLPKQALRNDLIAVVGGLALYGLFVVKLHGLLIGMPLL